MALAAAATALGLHPAPASASEPARTGWWSSANTGPVQAPPPPDVPDDGLYVQGGPPGSAPTAFSAVLYEIATDEAATKLTLKLAGSSSSPNLAVQACPIPSGDFASGPNQPATAAPAYDANHCVAGEADAASASVAFKLSSITAEGKLALAIVPVGPTDRAAFAKPDTSSLATEAATTSSSSSSDSTSSETFTPPAPDSSTATPSSPSAAPETFDFSSALTPAAAAPPPATAAAPAPAVAAPAAAAPSAPARLPSLPAVTTSSSGTAGKIGSLMAMALLLAALAAYVRGFGLMGGRITD
jgi:hypothetical protein